MKTFRNLAKKYSVNPTPTLEVDEDVQSMFLPLNLMQQIMFCSKYRIKDNIITPNSLITKLVTMFATLVFIFLLILSSYMVVLSTSSLKYISFVIYDCIYYSFGFALNFVITILQTKNNIQFVLTFQKVHRFINNETSFSHIIVWNWIIVIVVLGFYIIVYTFLHIQIGLPLHSSYSAYLWIIFDFKIIYVIRVIQFLENKLVLWNTRVLNSQEMEYPYRENYNTKVFQTYVNILKCYDIHKDGYQQFILFHTISIFTHSLINIQILIDISKSSVTVDNTDNSILSIMMMTFWLMKDLSWQTVLHRQCEKFYLTIQNVHDTCALVLKSTCSDYERKLCKNVLRLHRASFSKFHVCGLFYLDAALQLSLMSLLTNYAVVLLQFAFL